MGLQERQKFAEVKEKHLPPKIEELKKITGTTIELSIDETSFSNVSAISALPDSLFTRLNSDLSEVCDNKLGKEAVAEAIKKIHVVNHAEKGFSLDLASGVLTIKAKFDGSLGEDMPSYKMYKKFLMEKL